MNEKFSELAAQVPELVEAIGSGKRPTKGEIVKASIARHQTQDRRIQELQLELQALRARNELQSVDAGSDPAASMPAITVDLSQQQHYSMPYQIQPSRPILQNTDENSVWLGQLFGKGSEQLDRGPAFQPTLVSTDSVSNVSPFKQFPFTSSWSYSQLQTQPELYSFSLGVVAMERAKTAASNGLLDQLSGSDTLSAFPSPTFTYSDTDSSTSSDAVDPTMEEAGLLTDNLSDQMGFEPFVISDNAAEETPLSALLNLPPMDADQSPGTCASVSPSSARASPRNSSHEEGNTSLSIPPASLSALPTDS